jgi:hypothetical protein
MKDTAKIRPVIPFTLNDDWNLIARTMRSRREAAAGQHTSMERCFRPARLPGHGMGPPRRIQLKIGEFESFDSKAAGNRPAAGTGGRSRPTLFFRDAEQVPVPPDEQSPIHRHR